jgi:hypothetical protein
LLGGSGSQTETTNLPKADLPFVLDVIKGVGLFVVFADVDCK